MTTQTLMPIPPRPSWMRRAEDAPPAKLPPKRSAAPPRLPRVGPIPEEIKQRRVLRSAGDTSAGVLVSAAIHVAILLLLNLWYFATRPGASGYVINCEILTGDDGAETELPAVVQAPVPDEPAPAEEEEAPVEVLPGTGGDEPKLARIGGGGLGTGEGVGGGGVGFFGTRAQGNSFVFVVDRSGSMDDGRLTVAKRELNRAIGSLRTDQKFYVLFYNGGMERMLTPSSPKGLVFATPEMRDEVRAWMRPVLADGGTKPGESLRTALKLEPDVIFFLTDGEIPDDTDETVRASNFRGTVIHTTALVSQKGEAILQQIAEDNGGTYRHIGEIASGAGKSQLPVAQLERRWRAADAKLRLARKYLREGRPRSGRRWLEKIIQEYPGSTQAGEAEQILSAL